jgi:hypothetical protein
MSVGGIALTGISVLVGWQQTLATTARDVKADVNDRLDVFEKNMLRELGHVRGDVAKLESKVDALAAKSDCLLCAVVLLCGIQFWQSKK